MSVYLLPRVRVFAELQNTPAAVNNVLPTQLIGGNAFVHTAAADDVAASYDPASGTTAAWPDRPAGGLVDQSSVAVQLHNALLQYLDAPTGPAKVATSTNQVDMGLNLATNSAGTRDALLGDRDVQVGDVVKLQFLNSGNPVTLFSYVKSLVSAVIPGVVSAASAGSGNIATAIADLDVTQTAGDVNKVELAGSATGYAPWGVGLNADTYTITVTTGSVGGDLTTARLQIRSASGLDDADEVIPGAAAAAFNIGALGLTGTFSINSGNPGTDDLTVGQVWVVDVVKAYTATTATSGGTYNYPQTTVYVAEVVKGGAWADLPEIRVTTTSGIDQRNPVSVSGSGVAVPLGTRGVTISFTGAGLILGDTFEVAVTGTTEGPVRTIALGHSYPAGVAATVATAATLFIPKATLAIPQYADEAATQINWTPSATEITLEDGITVFDASYTVSGTPVALPVAAGTAQHNRIGVSYRAWMSDLSRANNIARTAADLVGIPGPTTEDNPLKYGLSVALANAGDVPIQYLAVANPDDLASWEEALSILTLSPLVYNLVALTDNPAVRALIQAYVNSVSTADEGQFCHAWFPLSGVDVAPVVHAGRPKEGFPVATSTNGQPVLATFSDDPGTTGTQYTLVTVPESNANFVTNQVRPGDKVRSAIFEQANGVESYKEYTVDAVLSENSLRLVTGPASAITLASRIEVWRQLNADEEAQHVAQQAGAYGSERVMALWPDKIETASGSVSGVYACAAVAALSSGVLPHRGLTRVPVAGFTGTDRTNKKFSRAQLDRMAQAGTWILIQDPTSGAIYTRHAVTTADYDDLGRREEVCQRNIDSLRYRCLSHFAESVGGTNITPDNLLRIRFEAETLITLLQNESRTPSLGGQIISGEVLSLEQHPTLRDKLILRMRFTIPAPLNNLDIVLDIVI